MENNNIDITKMTIIELKALAYEQVKELNRIQQNIQLIEAELEKRKQSKVEEPKDLSN